MTGGSRGEDAAGFQDTRSHIEYPNSISISCLVVGNFNMICSRRLSHILFVAL